jgi:hypothetical protein
MNWLHYLLEANIYLGVFYVAYCLFLNKETHYLLNRLYLVLSSIVSFILPVLQLGILLPPLPEPSDASSFVAEQVTNVPAPIAVPVQVTAPALTLQDGLWYMYLAGAIVCAVLLAIKLCSLFKLIRANKVTVQDNYKVVYLKDTNTAFSFFNYLFIGTAANNERTILRHELVHIRQMHSADIIFLELLKIINWFNPLVYMLQNSLKTQHEYIADEQTVTEEADATSYSSFLVNNAYGLSGPAITHSFYNLNLLKNRIIMLHQQRSGNLARLKYLVAVPIGVALLCASTLGFSKTYGWIDLAPHNINKQNIEATQQQNDQPKVTDVRLKSPSTPPASGFQNKPVKVTDVKLKSPKVDQVKFPPPIAIPDMPGGFKPQKTYVNEKGYKIEEGGYTTSGRTYYRVIISHPSGKKMQYESGHASNKLTYYKDDHNKRQIKMLYDKYGYKFPDVKVSQLLPPPPEPQKPKNDQVRFPPPIVMPDVPADFKPEKSYVNAKGFKVEEGPFTIGNKTYYVAIISNTTTGKKNTYYKGLNERRIKPELEDLGYKFPDVKVSPIYPAKVDQVKFPPPVVKPNPFTSEFFKFIGDHVKYPTEAREKGTMGYVVVEIKIEDYIITNSRIINGIGHGCDEEVLRVLNTYKNKTKVKSGTYKVSVAFMLGDPDNPIANPPMPKSAKETSGHVVIVGYGIKK